MKKIVCMMLAICVLGLSSGCATMWNSDRVKQNMVKERIVVTGSQEQKAAVARGMKPTTALAIIPTQDARGAYVAMDVFSLPTFWETVKEAPVSTFGAVVVDSALVGLGIYAIQKAGNSNSGSGGSGDQNGTASGEDSSSVNVQTGDNSPVNVNVNSGNTSTKTN